MTDRIVKVLENGRLIARGLSIRNGSVFLALDEDETLSVTVNWSDWLGSDTIDSVENDATGVTVASESNTTTQASFNVSSSPGLIEHRITTAAGFVKELRVVVNSQYVVMTDDYGFTHGGL